MKCAPDGASTTCRASGFRIDLAVLPPEPWARRSQWRRRARLSSSTRARWPGRRPRFPSKIVEDIFEGSSALSCRPPTFVYDFPEDTSPLTHTTARAPASLRSRTCVRGFETGYRHLTSRLGRPAPDTEAQALAAASGDPEHGPRRGSSSPWAEARRAAAWYGIDRCHGPDRPGYSRDDSRSRWSSAWA